MQLNSDSLKKIAAMSDDDFKKFISDAASESGMALPSISVRDIERVRSLLSGIEKGDPLITQAVDGIAKSLKKGKAPN